MPARVELMLDQLRLRRLLSDRLRPLLIKKFVRLLDVTLVHTPVIERLLRDARPVPLQLHAADRARSHRVVRRIREDQKPELRRLALRIPNHQPPLFQGRTGILACSFKGRGGIPAASLKTARTNFPRLRRINRRQRRRFNSQLLNLPFSPFIHRFQLSVLRYQFSVIRCSPSPTPRRAPQVRQSQSRSPSPQRST